MQKIYYFIITALLTLIVVGCKENVTEPEPSPYDNASVSKGGIMYDKFWSTEAGFDQGSPNLATFTSMSDFFRCKQCHAWDLLGRSGSYIGRAPKTSRPNVSAVNLFQIAKTKSAQEIFDGLKKSTGRRDVSYDLSAYNPTSNNTIGDQMPDFSKILSDAQIWDIVKFLKEGALDVSQLYDAAYTGTYPTGSAVYSNIGKDGNASDGKSYFASRCASCHGAEGSSVSLEDNMTVGQFLRSKPNEVQHKVKFGQLGSSMIGTFAITLNQMKDLYKALTDTLAFPNR